MMIDMFDKGRIYIMSNLPVNEYLLMTAKTNLLKRSMLQKTLTHPSWNANQIISFRLFLPSLKADYKLLIDLATVGAR